MIRRLAWLLSLVALLSLAACSSNEPNSPPRISFLYPDNHHHYVESPDGVKLDPVDDDGEILTVVVYMDDKHLSTIDQAPWTTNLPLGEYADGFEYKVKARCVDNNGAYSAWTTINISVDPSLQTVAQMESLEDEEGFLRATWHAFPDPEQLGIVYDWEIARDSAFEGIVASGTTSEVTILSEVTASGVAYARVRVSGDFWSRSIRFNAMDTARERYSLDDPQLGTRLIHNSDGVLRVLSHAIEKHRVSKAPVQLLTLDEDLQLTSVVDLLDDTYTPTMSLVTTDEDLVLAGNREDGTTFLAAFDQTGGPLWETAPTMLAATGLLQTEAGLLFVFGQDLAEDADLGGKAATLAMADGSLTEAFTFLLETGRTVLTAWTRPEGGYVLGGSLPNNEENEPGGIFTRGIDESGALLWNVRLGTSDAWMFRNGGADGRGNYLLNGIALKNNVTKRYGFVACIDQRGRVRWQVTNRNWHLYAGAAPDAGNRWVVAGVRRRQVDESRYEYDFALSGFSEAGEVLWEARHASGQESQGWDLLAHPDGGWWTVGTGSNTGSNYDVDLLRVDDLGELSP